MLRTNHERGFTMIEALFCLFLLSLLLLLTPRLHTLFTYVPTRGECNELEWTIFLEQAQMEFREAQSVEVFNKRLIMKNRYGFTVTYTLYGTQLIRKVQGAGNEVLLQNVKNISYTLDPSTLTIRADDLRSKQHEGVVTRYAPLKTG